MSEYRRQRYAELSDADLQAAIARDWRTYYESPTDSDAQIDVYDALIDARAVCRDRGNDSWWTAAMGDARQKCIERRAASRLAQERLIRGLLG